ncbi:MAG: hypothetical protein EOP11_04965 [Proteobacteria bacterium]|nr:MAG: hypothetical protein EOP11_04965 [Pseudomonadota bacterium]
MKKLILGYLMRKIALKQAGAQQFHRGFTVKRLGPLGGLLAIAMIAVVAVIGLIGFVIAGVGLSILAIGRSFFASPKISPRRAEPTITVLDASGKTVAEVPRSA